MEEEGLVPQEGQNNCVDIREYKVFESLWAEQLAGVMYLFKWNVVKKETVGTQHGDWIKKGLEWTKVGLDSVNYMELLDVLSRKINFNSLKIFLLKVS